MKERPKAAKPLKAAVRRTYRHGDLQRALIEAGVSLARALGPEGVVVREATRQAGVAPNAAYRHFANRAALFDAVRDVALSAMAQAMEHRLNKLGEPRDNLGYARKALHAVGLAYLQFSRREPGLFRTAFAVRFDATKSEPSRAGRSGLNPFELLGAALDRLVAVGAMPAANRPGADYLAWSAVHGLAMLSMDGPLRRAPAAEREALAERMVEIVERGLRSGG